MNITTVSASVRFSKDVGNKQFKTIELSAGGTVNANEIWQAAQAQLYAELGHQLKSLWITNGNGNTNTGPQETVPAHYCQQHKAEFKRYEKEGRVWYSHKSGDGWCRENASHTDTKSTYPG